MVLKVQPAYIGQTGYQHPVELDRNLIEGIWGRTGATRAGEFRVATGTGTRAIQVSPGRAVLVGTENATQGAYFAWSDATETFNLAASVGNPRIDTLLLRVMDDQYGTISGSPRAEWAVVQGVAAGSPVARADSDFNVGGTFYIPGAWWRVADVLVNVGDASGIPSGQIANTYQHVRGSARSIVSRSNQTISSGDLTYGDSKVDEDTGIWFWWNGTVWLPRGGQLLGESLLASSDVVISAGAQAVIGSVTLAANLAVTGLKVEVYAESSYLYSAGTSSLAWLAQVAGATGGTSDPAIGNTREANNISGGLVPFTISRSATLAATGQRTFSLINNFFSGSGNMTWRRSVNTPMKIQVVSR